MAGRSYTAATQWMAAAQRPPHLKAIFPTVVGANFFKGWVYQGGAFQLGFNLFWVHLMTRRQEEALARRPVQAPATEHRAAARGECRWRVLPRLARPPHKRRVLVHALDRPPLRRRRGARLQRRRLVRPLPGRNARELRAAAARGRLGARAQRDAPARGPMGAWQHLRGLPGPRLRPLHPGGPRGHRRDPARLLRAPAARRGQGDPRGAGPALCDGGESLARRGRLAASARPRGALVPARRWRGRRRTAAPSRPSRRETSRPTRTFSTPRTRPRRSAARPRSRASSCARTRGHSTNGRSRSAPTRSSSARRRSSSRWR